MGNPGESADKTGDPPFHLTADDILALARWRVSQPADVELTRASWRAADDLLDADPDALRAYLDGAERLRALLDGPLWRYAQHHRDCPGGPSCRCGLEAFLADVRAALAPPEGTPFACHRCGGSGAAETIQTDAQDGPRYVGVCSACRGTGRAPAPPEGPSDGPSVDNGPWYNTYEEAIEHADAMRQFERRPSDE